MAKITEQEIINFLEGKIEKFQKKLLQVRTVLKTLKVSHAIDKVKLKKKDRKNIRAAKTWSGKAGKKENESSKQQSAPAIILKPGKK